MKASSLRTGTMTEMNGTATSCRGVNRPSEVEWGAGVMRRVLAGQGEDQPLSLRAKPRSRRCLLRKGTVREALHGLNIRQTQQTAERLKGDAGGVKERPEQQANVHPRAEILDVVEVVTQLPAHTADVGVGGQLHLGQPGNAGPHGQTVAVRWQRFFQFGQELGALGAR